MNQLTNEYKVAIATELAAVRNDNNSNGSPQFQEVMSMLEDSTYDADFNDIIEIANTL